MQSNAAERTWVVSLSLIATMLFILSVGMLALLPVSATGDAESGRADAPLVEWGN